MYERNAIVLERYFEGIFGFKNNFNLRKNYFNYRKLFETYETYCSALEAEEKAQKEFDEASSNITKIQKTQERLYNKGAKFEYSRYVIFNNIKETPENISKYLDKVYKDAQKNSEDLKDLGDKFVTSVESYNEKSETLASCQAAKAKAQKEFEKAYDETKTCIESIPDEDVTFAKQFIDSENKDTKKELTEIFNDNGKNERNPFDPDVITNAIVNSFSIYKNELDVYLNGLDRAEKLLNEIEFDIVKNDKHRKYYNDSKLKLDFYNAEKDYLVQFLDNERITAMYDQKVHRKLMLDACRNLNADFVQINNLYDIILKEIAGRSTKKLYKENYNKEYLLELENSSNALNMETNKIKAKSMALMNLNYWRIEGIRRIYEVFDEDITQIYGKDLSEFNPAETFEDDSEEDSTSQIIEEIESIVEDEKPQTIKTEKIAKKTEIKSSDLMLETTEEIKPASKEKTKKKKSKYGVLKSSKKALANAIYISLQIQDNEMQKRKMFEKEQKQNDKSTVAEEDHSLFSTEEDDEEESILDLYFKSEDKNTAKRKARDNKMLEEETNKKNKKGIFKKIIGINAKEKIEA